MTPERKLEFTCEFSEKTRSGHVRVVGRNLGASVRVGDLFTRVLSFTTASRLLDRRVEFVPSSETRVDLSVKSVGAFEQIFDELPSGYDGQLILDGPIFPSFLEHDRLLGGA